jgi:hypothetical protein
MSDELAKAMFDAYWYEIEKHSGAPRVHEWDEQKPEVQAEWLAYARAALSFLGFPEGAEVKKGCVGEAMRILSKAPCKCEEYPCWTCDALRALGEERGEG